MTASAPASAARTAPQLVGLTLLHGGTAAWIGYGAVVKALEFNPNLLPPPILELLRWLTGVLSVDPGVFLTWSLRAIIGAEIFIVLTILLSTRFARTIAIGTLGLFCLILLVAMGQTAVKDGLVKALTGGCGCFGEQGLPASVMFLIDGALLLTALLLVPAKRAGSTMPLMGAFAAGVIAVFAIPEPTMAAPEPTANESAVSTDTTATQVPDPSATPSGGQSAPTEPPQPSASAIVGPWPAAPTKYERNYFPRWKTWVGKPLREQKLALAIERPLPNDFERGDWLVVFSRSDCEDCQSLYRANFAVPRPERILKVTVPDSRGTPLGMPCVGCEERMVFRVKAGETGKSPEYVFRTPVVVRMKDGIVTAVCEDRTIAAEYDAVFGKSAAAVAPPTQPVSVAPPVPTWPGPPTKLEPFYVAEFGDVVGKKLADLPFARLVENKLPANFLRGRWIVVYYREDCDHCFEMLSTHFGGTLKYPTLTIAIPDADPNAILGNPCDACTKVSMIKGPNYVIGTPVVLAIKDGVIECVVENVDDMAALEKCLDFTTP